MVKKVLILTVIFLLLPLNLVFANELPTTIEFEMKLGISSQLYDLPSSLIETLIRNYTFYLLIDEEVVPLNLYTDDVRNLARFRTITKQVKKGSGIADGVYQYSITHGLDNNEKSKTYSFTVTNGQIIYDGLTGNSRHLFVVPLNVVLPPDSPATGEDDNEDNEGIKSELSPIWGRPIKKTLPDSQPDNQIDQNNDSVWEDVEDGEDFWGDVHYDNSMAARIFTNIVQSFMLDVWRFLGLHDPVTLFFNVSPADIFSEENYAGIFKKIDFSEEKLNKTLYVEPDNAFLYMFTDAEHSIIGRVFDVFSSLLQIPYVVVIAIVGALILLRGFTAEEKSTIKVLVGGILLFPFMLKFVPYLFEPFFWLNYTIVRSLGAALTTSDTVGKIAPLSRPFVTILIGSGTGIGSLGVAIGTLILLIMTAILNFQYFVRRFMLALLIMMFPIVAFLQIFPGTRETFRLWWSEFSANLFLQSAHAMIYVMFIHYVYEAKLPFIPVVAMLATLATMTAFVRNLMGCRPGFGISGLAGGMLGIGALMGAGRIAGGVIKGITGGNKNILEDSRKSSIGEGQSRGQEGAFQLASPAPANLNLQDDQETGTVSTNEATIQQASNEESASSEESSFDYSAVRTGPQWGRKPLVPQVNIYRTVGKAAAGTALAGGMLVGTMAGGAMIGPTGIGLGAMTGTGFASMGVKTGNYFGGIVSNRLATRQIVKDVMQKYPDMKNDKDYGYERATVMAATGVDAKFDEIKNDKVMLDMYRNFTDSAGFANLRKKIDSVYASREQQIMWDKIAQVREQYSYNNPSSTPQQVNSYILNNIIRNRQFEETTSSDNPEEVQLTLLDNNEVQ